MKSKLILLLIIAILLFTLCGCGSNVIAIDDVIKSPDTNLVDFEIVENNYWCAILVDKNTNVLYYWITASAGGITPILNNDGTPKLLEEK